ncbi:RDD family protein [Lutimaribacter sp. EGI FJ00015]|uniref:RDD family protein n=1 Tax=Lutimaribacter degradans TaxID=2945989 RepID=A0ACC5ZWH1_9RHOB|nr:RDD family protein [Lutimaribacter sp. EGI FJ00013]MCM2562392.1 RDD family protein [Lutimaribacter sp. EGI FJ00013]MCO0613549.1 RDD family protein [Lutimaribacter sp. EGI FJ00015]MCO0636521.1 RDD family protein [Lutimaribacter sp. EGI FJ00014]
MTYSALPDPHLQPEFYADVPMKRLLAFVIDTVIIVIGCLVILPFTAFTGIFFFPILMLVVGTAYRVVTLANRSATLGMRLMAIEFRTHDGRPFDALTAVLHTVGFTVSMGVFVAQAISVVMMLVDERGQGLSDKVLGSVALNRRARR